MTTVQLQEKTEDGSLTIFSADLNELRNVVHMAVNTAKNRGTPNKLPDVMVTSGLSGKKLLVDGAQAQAVVAKADGSSKTPLIIGGLALVGLFLWMRSR